MDNRQRRTSRSYGTFPGFARPHQHFSLVLSETAMDCSNPRCSHRIANPLYFVDGDPDQPVCSLHCRLETKILVKWNVLGDKRKPGPYHGVRKQEQPNERRVKP